AILFRIGEASRAGLHYKFRMEDHHLSRELVEKFCSVPPQSSLTTGDSLRATNSMWFCIELHNFCIARLKKNGPNILCDNTTPYDAHATTKATKVESSFSILRLVI